MAFRLYGAISPQEDEVGRISKDYFKDLYNMDTEEQVQVCVCYFDIL